MRLSRDSSVLAALFLAVGLATAGPLPASPAKLALRHQRLELPGVPVLSLAVDLDRDGRRDLAVVVASTSWGEVGIEEPMQVDEEGTFVDVLTVVPTVLDRRELLVFLGLAEGVGAASTGAPSGPNAYAAAPLRLELPPCVHAVAAGPAAAPLVAWTDDGVAEVVLVGEGDNPSEGATGAIEPIGATGPSLELVPRIAARTIFAGSTSFLARSGLIDDLDGDGDSDLFVPVAGGLEVYLATPEGLSATAATLVAPPEDEAGASEAGAEAERAGRSARRSLGVVADILLPQVLDLNGDRLPDLLFRDPERAGSGVRGRLNLGEGRFGPVFDPLPGWAVATVAAGATAASESASEKKKEEAPSREVAWLGDLEGDGPAEVVTSEEIPNAKDSMRAELAEAKRPHARIRVHALGGDGRWNPAPKAEFTVEGYVFEGGGRREGGEDEEGGGFSLPGGVLDLDGDGRLDLVALTLDFSLFEAMRVLATKSIKLGLDFRVYRQGEGLSFRPVTGLDLAGELRLRLDSLALGQLSSFSGDFDGDGRADFLQLGRGRKVTIHRGQPGARYAPEPDLVVTLEREPLDAALVTVADLDGDGRSDLAVTQPIGGKAIGARAALDLYLSGSPR
ncbi:MAG: VCBS repeat-containing protein [Thermoanaerobaculia bacterium]|nr:VCBS repeat-containing protein [Thermoanaerobaculia bacterium]